MHDSISMPTLARAIPTSPSKRSLEERLAAIRRTARAKQQQAPRLSAEQVLESIIAALERDRLHLARRNP